MNRLLITGGAGFIGSNLISRLSENRSYEISVIDDESLGNPDIIKDKVQTYVKADFRDRDTLDKLLPHVDCVIHLAADTRVIDSISNPQRNFDINVVGTFELLRGCVEHKVRQFVNASTGGAIIGEATPPVNEDMVPRPTAPYGASKLAVEGYCSAFGGAYGLQTTSLRFSNIYGPLSFHKGSVVAHFFKRVLKGEPLIVYGDGTQTRDYLFVHDQVAGILSAVEKAASGVFQLGSGRPTDLNTLIATMRDVVDDRPFPDVVYEDFRQGELKETWCDISKAKLQLGFNPTTELRDGIRSTWEWFKENENLFT